MKTKIFTVIIILLLLTIYLCGCNEDVSDGNELVDNEGKRFLKDVQLLHAFLDSEDNLYITCGFDTYTTTNGSDGHSDVLYFTKYDPSGNKIIENITILSSIGFNYPYFRLFEEETIYIIWFDLRNNYPNLTGEPYSYRGDIYYKIIDTNGSIIKNDSKVTSEFLDPYNYSYFNLSKINDIQFNGTVADFRIKYSYNDDFISFTTGINDTGKLTYMPKEIEHERHRINVTSYGSIYDYCNIIYSRISTDGELLIEEKEIVRFEKLQEPNYDEGPWLYDLNLIIDSKENVHLIWLLNDGGKDNSIYYMKIDKDGNIMHYEKIAD